MNETITLPRLAELIAAATSVSIDVAEAFAKDFFAHIEDALAVTDSVMIDGLGCFVRKSDSSQPVTFIPDDKMNEALNRPFAMFVPVPVGENDISDIKDNDSVNTIEPTDNGSDTTISIDKTTITEIDQIETVTVASEDILSEGKKIVQADEPTPEEPGDITESPTYTPPKYEISELEENHTKRQPGIIWILLLFLLGLIVGIGLGYLYHDTIAGLLNNEDNQVKIIDTRIVEYEETNNTDTIIAPIVNVLTDSLEFESEDLIEIPHEEIYDTVTPHRFLTTMARQYYGPMEFWVFIYEANSDHLGHPNRIRPGTRVLIPDRSAFANDEDDEQLILKAKKMSREIYNRFD